MKLKNRSNIIKIQLEVRDKNVNENFRNVKSFLKILVSTWSDFEKTVGWCWIEVDNVKPHAIYVCHMPSNLHPLICSSSLISITLNRSSITWASVLLRCMCWTNLKEAWKAYVTLAVPHAWKSPFGIAEYTMHDVLVCLAFCPHKLHTILYIL